MAASITIRPVDALDDERGFFDVLSQLTEAPRLRHDVFVALVQRQRADGTQQTMVALNAENRVVATASVFIEPKFVRGGSPAAHIEDVVVLDSVRGLGVGARLVERLVAFAKERSCYKVVLDCTDSNVGFYLKCGFQPRERQMALYLPSSSKELPN